MAMTKLAAYLAENEAWYKHNVGMADAMSRRNDEYGESEAINYLSKASRTLLHMQTVSGDPTSYDLEMN
jgi:hypothetical protein